MTKVLMVSEIWPPDDSGGGRSTYNLAHALDQREEIDLTVLLVNKDNPDTEGLEVENISVPRFPNELAYRKIREEIKERESEYDIIQSQHSLTIPPLAGLDTPTIGVVRDYWPLCYRTTLRDRWGNNHDYCGVRCWYSTVRDWGALSPYKFYNHKHRKKITRDVDSLQARSDFVRDRLIRQGFQGVGVKRNFVPEGFGEDVEGDKDVDVVLAGNLERYKGPQLLLESVPEILKEHPGTQVAFLGDGSLKNGLEKRAGELGVKDRVDFTGESPHSEALNYMKSAGVVVVPSLWYEPLSRVVVESMALGTPVVTTKYGGNKEVSGVRTVDAIPQRIGWKVNELLENPVQVDYENRREDIIEEWINLYEDLRQ